MVETGALLARVMETGALLVCVMETCEALASVCEKPEGDLVWFDGGILW